MTHHRLDIRTKEDIVSDTHQRLKIPRLGTVVGRDLKCSSRYQSEFVRTTFVWGCIIVLTGCGFVLSGLCFVCMFEFFCGVMFHFDGYATLLRMQCFMQ